MLKKKKPLSLIMFFLALTAIVGIITLIMLVMLGYSGFKAFHAKSSVITLELGCQNTYFLEKYGDAVNIVMKISYICTLGSTFLSVLLLVYLILVIYSSDKKSKSTTILRVEQLREQSSTIPEEIQYRNPAIIFVLSSLIVIMNYVSFCQFIQYRIQIDNTICHLNGNIIELDSLVAVLSIMFIFSLLAFVSNIVSTCLFESDRQVRQIIRRNTKQIKENQNEEIQSQRKLIKEKIYSQPCSIKKHIEEEPPMSDEAQSKEMDQLYASKMEEGKEEEEQGNKQEEINGISTIQRVQSVLEVRNPYLNLESNLTNQNS